MGVTVVAAVCRKKIFLRQTGRPLSLLQALPRLQQRSGPVRRRAACWGVDTQGQLADPDGFIRTAPVTVQGLTTSGLTVTSMAVHEGEHSCALLNDSTVRCWGWNIQGQLGDGTLTPRFEPTPVLMQ